MKLNQFSELTSLTDSDLLLGWDAETATTRSVKAVTLKSYAGVTAANQRTLTYNSNGDSNGIFYYLGSYDKINEWGNPYIAGQIGIEFIPFNFDNWQPASIVNRLNDNGFATTNVANSSLLIDIKSRKLKPNYYSIRARAFNQNHLKSWKLQATNNTAGSWIDLSVVSLGAALTSSQWYSASINTNDFYRFFRILQTGLNSSNDNILTFGEIELYGVLQ